MTDATKYRRNIARGIWVLGLVSMLIATGIGMVLTARRLANVIAGLMCDSFGAFATFCAGAVFCGLSLLGLMLHPVAKV